ncbi:conjugal transfer protein TraG N-terminal domain-containing protein [Biomphalaria pfeifferi]|uniref:Conjugal transfer protein TraG N-terminal domain-containing protein n=1 Tax=Biomphalaria pfeifferi TaxID=112525 RepID=A0AAD8AQ39_BIOPF|nr:conjugal transfer protein TraG N-terminal domain-containing protein [Biomphalaria pfeifferi]
MLPWSTRLVARPIASWPTFPLAWLHLAASPAPLATPSLSSSRLPSRFYPVLLPCRQSSPISATASNGIMFGSRMIQETRRASIPDPMVRTDLMNFVQNCTSYDIADGTISPTAFSQSADLWAMMAFTNPARFSIITTAAGVTTNTCDAVYASIDARLPAQLNDLQAKLGLRLNPSLAPAAANAAVAAQITQGYIRSQIAGAAAAAADLIRQNAIINAINDAGEMGCQKINDPSCMMLASGRASAVAAQNAAWINGAKIAEQALPVVRNVAEAMMYAVFPLVVLLLFITSSKTTFLMLGGYTAALVSIQLWPPLFAILNYMGSIYSQLDQAAAARDRRWGQGSLFGYREPHLLQRDLLSGCRVLPGHWHSCSCYSLANRLVNFGSSVMGGLQGLQTASMSGNASAAAAVGNANMGNVTMDQRIVSPSNSNPFVSREQTPEGDWITTTASGVTATSFLRNEGAVSRVVSTSVSDGMVTEASRAAEAARSSAVSASKELSSTLVDTMSTASSRFRGSTQTAGQTLSSVEEVGKSADRLKGLSEQLSQGTRHECLTVR